jgi:hypothetical protein
MNAARVAIEAPSASRVSAATRQLQPKLHIGPVDDPLEREADRIADQVMGTPDPGVLPMHTGSPSNAIRRKAVFRPDSGCSDFAMCEIVAAWDLAVGLVDDTIAAVDDVITNGAKSKHHSTVTTRFPGASAAQLASVKATLTSIKAELASSIVSSCVQSGEPCVGNALAATTCKPNADVQFCTLFNVGADCRTQAAAIIHELAHHIVCLVTPAIEVTKKQKREVERDGKKEIIEEEVKEKTGDVYRHFPEFATLTVTQALQNPDSFAVLCLNASNRSDCFDCSTIMQTDKKKWDAMKKRLKSEHTAPAAKTEDVQRKCAACEESELHRRGSDASLSGSTASAAAQHAIDGLSGGTKLSSSELAFFEPRFGHEFGRVRVHSDSAADRAAKLVGARAFTLGSDIAFARGEYRPGSAEGRALLAHELVHVMQQGDGASTLSRKCAACEAEEEHTLRRKAASDGRGYFEPRFRQESFQPIVRRKPAGGGSLFAPFFGEDPIHAPLIADYRHRHGLPPGGVDEFGNPVGPSDAMIKYQLLPAEFLPPCPDVQSEKSLGDVSSPGFRQAFLATNCVTAASQAMPPACMFSTRQERTLADAQQEASSRVERALNRITKAGAAGGSFARDLAGRVFSGEPPTVKEAVAMLKGVSGFLSGKRIDFSGRTCGEPNCQRLPVVAYVLGPGQLPVYVCPLAFSHPAELPRTILHEALHWSGLDADPATPEGYCEKFDCLSPCQGKDTADAWAHYLDCLGQPLETRRSFVDKIVESAEEIP